LFAQMEEAVYDDLIEFFLRNDTHLECDFVYRWNFASPHWREHEYEDYQVLTDPRLGYIPDLTRQRNLRSWRSYRLLKDQDKRDLEVGFEKYQELIRRFAQAGGKLLIGTDGSEGRMVGLGVHRELQFFVEAGLTPMQALVAATSRPAQFIGRDDLGSLEAGKVADVLILGADPLQDITNTRKIETVIKDGRVVDTSFHPSYSNPLPRPYAPVLHGFPVPQIDQMQPTMVVEGSGPLELLLEGGGFVPQSVVEFDGTRLSTEWENGRTLRATLPADLLRRVGTYQVLVRNPQPVSAKDPLHEDDRSNPHYLIVQFA
jgi:hypothetical protein